MSIALPLSEFSVEALVSELRKRNAALVMELDIIDICPFHKQRHAYPVTIIEVSTTD